MMEKGLIKKQAAPIAFRNKALATVTKNNYVHAVQQYRAYCINNGMVEGQESVKSWLGTIDKARVYNLKKTALKEYLFEKFKDATPEQRLELRELFDNLPKRTADVAVVTNFMPIEQVQELVDIVNKTSQRMALVIESLFWTACRISELVNIKQLDIEINGEVSIRVRGKGDKDRIVFMQKDLYKRIKRAFKGTTWLFETRTGTHLDGTNISNYIKRMGKDKLGINISAHTMRHSRAMDLKRRGCSPDETARILGHSTSRTTIEFYYHGTPDLERIGIKSRE